MAQSSEPARPMFSLQGKTVVVTGGGRGLGRGISNTLARAGANVVLTGRNAEALERTAEEVRARGVRAIPLQADITRHEDIQHMVDVTLNEFGYIDGWVNNAGSADPADVGRLIDLNEGQWDRVVDLNLKWTFFCAQAAARAMTRGGSIVNISSRAGSGPSPMNAQYGAAKAGLDALTATMAVEWGHMDIRVNGIAPGVVLTDSLGGHVPGSTMGSESRRRRQIETVPLRRLGVVEDIGALAVYLIADESNWITGQVIQANGGSRITVGLLSYLHKVNLEAEQRAAAEAS